MRFAIQNLLGVSLVGALALLASTTVQSQEPALPLELEQVPDPAPIPPRLLVRQPAKEAESQPLSLESLQQIALEHNPALARAEALTEAAHGRWMQAGLRPNPTVGYSGQQLGSGGVAEQQGVLVGQKFILGGKRQLDRAIAEQGIQRAQQHRAVLRQRVLTDVATGYYNLLTVQRRLELAGELVEISNQAVKAAEARLKADVGTRSDLLQSRIEANSTAVLLRQSRNDHLYAWRSLAAVLGTPNATPQPLAGQLEDAIPDLNWEESRNRLLTESPEIAAARINVQRAQWVVQRAHAEVVPDVEVQGVFQRDNSTGSNNGNLQVTLPLPLWNRNQGGIYRADSELIAAQQAVQRVELHIERRLADVFRRYINARYLAESYAKEILPSAKENMELVLKLYQAGEVGSLNLITAQRTYFQTNMKHFQALREMRQAANEIEGLLLSDSLQAR